MVTQLYSKNNILKNARSWKAIDKKSHDEDETVLPRNALMSTLHSFSANPSFAKLQEAKAWNVKAPKLSS